MLKIKIQYKPEFVRQAYKLCLLGAINEDLARFFDVTESTFYKWLSEKEEFSEAIKRGREIADANVGERLYHRAIGYSHESVHVSNYQGDITLTPITKHYPPDTVAAIFWLKNRQPARWRDTKHLDVHKRSIDDLTDEELDAELAAVETALAEAEAGQARKAREKTVH